MFYALYSFSYVFIGLIFAAYINGVARQPEARGLLQPIAFLGFALAEALAIFGLAARSSSADPDVQTTQGVPMNAARILTADTSADPNSYPILPEWGEVIFGLIHVRDPLLRRGALRLPAPGADLHGADRGHRGGHREGRGSHARGPTGARGVQSGSSRVRVRRRPGCGRTPAPKRRRSAPSCASARREGAARISTAGQQQMEAERQQAMVQLRGEVGRLAVDTRLPGSSRSRSPTTRASSGSSTVSSPTSSRTATGRSAPLTRAPFCRFARRRRFARRWRFGRRCAPIRAGAGRLMRGIGQETFADGRERLETLLATGRVDAAALGDALFDGHGRAGGQPPGCVARSLTRRGTARPKRNWRRRAVWSAAARRGGGRPQPGAAQGALVGGGRSHRRGRVVCGHLRARLGRGRRPPRRAGGRLLPVRPHGGGRSGAA